MLINLVFGLTISILLVRYDFPGKRLLSALLDVPLSVSPVVVGLALVLVYNGRDGWFGPALEEAGFQIIFSTPGMIMATVFVALPLMIREVVPVLEEIGDDQEQAARSLGANAVQTLRRITLPAIKWAVVYGVVLSLARSLGEFGAVKIVSGNIAGQSQTATLAVEETYQNFQQGTAYALAALLAFIAMACLVIVAILRPKERTQKVSINVIQRRQQEVRRLRRARRRHRRPAHRPADRAARAQRWRQVHAAADHRRPRGRRQRHRDHRGQRGDPPAAAEAQRGLRLPALRGLQAHERGQERRVRPRDPQAPEGGDREARSPSCSSWCTSRQFAHRLPAQLSGGQRQRMALARALAVEPTVLLLDEPFGALDAKVRKELREWLRRLHDEVHVTTVFVTHDQEEALEVADEIVVINDGRIEQIGTPDQLYDEPASDFVMSFLGPVTTLDGQAGPAARHRGVTRQPEDRAGQSAGKIVRLLRVGFEVRLTVELEQADHPDVEVTVTRATQRHLSLEEGTKVWLTPTHGAPVVPAMESSLSETSAEIAV